MLAIERERLEKLREEYPKGTRIKLIAMDDAQAPPVGTLGTVTGVDDTGSIMMNWDNGSTLNLLLDFDRFKKM